MSIGLLLLLTVILAVSVYALAVTLPDMKRAELERRRRYRAQVRAREEYYQRELFNLYINTIIKEFDV